MSCGHWITQTGEKRTLKFSFTSVQSAFADSHCLQAIVTTSSGKMSAINDHASFVPIRPIVVRPFLGILRCKDVHRHRMNVRSELKRRPKVPRVFGSGTQPVVFECPGTGDEKAPMRLLMHESNANSANMADEGKVQRTLQFG